MFLCMGGRLLVVALADTALGVNDELGDPAAALLRGLELPILSRLFLGGGVF